MSASPGIPELPAGPAVLEGGFIDAAAAAAWLLAEQERLGRRLYIAIVAAGDRDGAFAADDVLASGAIVDALIDLGIDDTSPEAAVACGAFTALRRAVRHLTGASGSGRSAVASGVDAATVHAASGLDSSTSVRVARVGRRGRRGERAGVASLRRGRQRAAAAQAATSPAAGRLRARCARTFARLPQRCIEHHRRVAARDVSR